MRSIPVLILAATALACTSEPTPQRPGAQHFADDSTCGDCHAAIVAEWRGSGHANAWTDPLVQHEFQSAGDSSCPACHAPETDDPAGATWSGAA